MSYSPRLLQLIDALRRLPGVGPKSAQRMAFHLLTRDRSGAEALVSALDGALKSIGRCPSCRMLCEEQCGLCQERRTATGQLCIVEQPSDLMAVERSTDFRGRYFVLMGRLSPLDGIGPDELGFDQLQALLGEGWAREVILALNPSVEAEATAHLIEQMAKAVGATVTRIAQGVPMGGEIEYVDGGTLAHAFLRRQRAVEEGS
jgi:recombination protein RecR